MARILVVTRTPQEDKLLELLARDGFEVVTASPATTLKRLQTGDFGLVVLHYSVLKLARARLANEIRQKTALPILVLFLSHPEDDPQADAFSSAEPDAVLAMVRALLPRRKAALAG